jgi:hypothetical protein
MEEIPRYRPKLWFHIDFVVGEGDTHCGGLPSPLPSSIVLPLPAMSAPGMTNAQTELRVTIRRSAGWKLKKSDRAHFDDFIRDLQSRDTCRLSDEKIVLVLLPTPLMSGSCLLEDSLPADPRRRVPLWEAPLTTSTAMACTPTSAAPFSRPCLPPAAPLPQRRLQPQHRGGA